MEFLPESSCDSCMAKLMEKKFSFYITAAYKVKQTLIIIQRIKVMFSKVILFTISCLLDNIILINNRRKKLYIFPSKQIKCQQPTDKVNILRLRHLAFFPSLPVQEQ